MRTPRQAARIAVLDPTGALFLFRYDNEEVGVHWAMPGGGLDPGEAPRTGALRELAEETGGGPRRSWPPPPIRSGRRSCPKSSRRGATPSATPRAPLPPPPRPLPRSAWGTSPTADPAGRAVPAQVV
ncbi:hypothetical protein HEK616_49000 [Streptomyces nigrescens]|uniref:Nudix hydrolase domain-containing protein n=2 Tax=Streptomyces TaxID=1883 RepID=A0ABM7ZYI7_STRNI|nr:NUDIX domain-containing protein [Streptomyces nigrescens]MEE4421479.1 NUDIX domain-containing protein [Streptomyces sp. DSM 41528]BDM71413.1 hypothetical protein HEK616_49000 [Streptomyces nigrescens]